MEVSVDIKIGAPKAAVWETITDIDQWADTISEIMSLEVLHRPKDGLMGLKWSETRKVFGKVSTETMWVTEAEDQSFYRTRAESHGAVYTSKLSIVESGGATLLTQSFSMTSNSMLSKLLSFVWGGILKRSLKKLILADLNDVKARVESRA